MSFSHLNSQGELQMVDVSPKTDTLREALAYAEVYLGDAVFEQVQKQQIRKGDVLTVAKIAGIQAAKQTPNLIPLCHTLLLNKIEVEMQLNSEFSRIEIQSRVRCMGKTGVEMEALTAVSVAALTVYDMCKALNPAIEIQNIKLLQKSGGKSDFRT